MDLESSTPWAGEEEATPTMAEEVQPSTPKDQYRYNNITGVLGALEPQEEVAESELGNDREASNNFWAATVKENKKQRDKQKDN